jgi:hypothetical protein
LGRVVAIDVGDGDVDEAEVAGEGTEAVNEEAVEAGVDGDLVGAAAGGGEGYGGGEGGDDGLGV